MFREGFGVDWGGLRVIGSGRRGRRGGAFAFDCLGATIVDFCRADHAMRGSLCDRDWGGDRVVVGGG